MTVTYRLAAPVDFEAFYKIKCDRENIRWSGFCKAPEKDSFRNWFLNQLHSTVRSIYLVVDENDNAVGFFYLDKVDDRLYEAASCGVLTEYAGQGIGTLTSLWQEELAKKAQAEVIQTWVSEKNIGSFRRLEKRGWRKTDEFEIKDLPLAGGRQRFFRWEKDLK